MKEFQVLYSYELRLLRRRESCTALHAEGNGFRDLGISSGVEFVPSSMYYIHGRGKFSWWGRFLLDSSTEDGGSFAPLSAPRALK